MQQCLHAQIHIYDRYGANQLTHTLLNAAHGLLSLGLVTLEDSDVKVSDYSHDFQRLAVTGMDAEIARLISLDDTLFAVSVCVASNLWQTNHHMGQKDLSGYVLKVLLTRYGPNDIPTLKQTVHMAGHWTSTLKVYRAAGMTTSDPGEPLIVPTGSLCLVEDARKRFQSLPAGTHKVKCGPRWTPQNVSYGHEVFKN